ncbi:ABC transporter substrate-binding protein [Compostimonas suwonensis]|uniref:ABC-type nitrate/sulfonate/bicarbonate transport system substrate-binding protein n=1 Tax=Compostimonas suwonensis TaxID=1048394 RepID=A0A2M9C413_9MICO|nr:ABC transporter substrate-binding protein [Compostimonas suwonensis]PJJ65217.1 ABC-type nitrate/sulfonate/bicarbonate transport system substrate-binding protein [Compostimonas suwonensis]
MKHAKYAVIPAAALLAVLTGCSTGGASGENSDGLTTLTVGISPFQDTYLPIIGEEKGWFEEAGLDVELKSLAWNSVMPAVISGDVDLAINNTTGVVGVANADPDVVYAYGLNPFTEGSALMIRPDGGLETVDELDKTAADHEEARTQAIEALAGKTIVTTLSTDMGKQINDALASVGMSESDVTFVDMDPDAGLAAFLSGTGDAYLGGVPQRAKALEEGMLVGLSGPDLAAPPINGIVTKRAFVEDDQDALLAFINVMHRIIRYCDAETDACGTTITDRLNEETAAGLTLDGFKSYWQNIELYAGNAQQASDMILADDGVAFWKTTWDSDNSYLVDTDAIPAEVPAADNFLMQSVWDAYVAEYGADETDY